MFTPGLTANRGRLSTPTGGVRDQSVNDGFGKRRSNLLTPRSKADSTFIRCNRSQNVENVPEHELVEYGASMPVLVTETLTLANGQANVRMDPNGWAWLVCDRKLIIWHYKPHVKVSQCYELELPACTRPHRACLVTVCATKQQSAVPACIAVSPDGVLRYWFNITMSSSYTELAITDIPGQHFTELITLQCGSCILGTSSSSLLLLNALQGQSRVSWSILKPAQGVLSGISRRVSSMFFSQTSTQPAVGELRRLLAGEVTGPDSQMFYVLSETWLQKWTLQADSAKMLYQSNLETLFVENMSHSVWKVDTKGLHLKTWLLDIQLTRDGIILLGAAVNPDVSTELHYAIGVLDTESDECPQGFISFSLISHYAISDEVHRIQDMVTYKPSYELLVPDICATSLYIHDNETVLCISANCPDLAPEAVDFPNLGCA
jgi:nuclear pore complex protein Nup133